MFQLAVSLAGSVEGLREKLRGAEGAAVITTKIYEWQLITMERTLPVILLNYRGIRGRDILVDNQTPKTPESYREFDIHVCVCVCVKKRGQYMSKKLSPETSNFNTLTHTHTI